VIGTGQCDDFNAFEGTLKAALKKAGVKLETKERKQLLDAVTWTAHSTRFGHLFQQHSAGNSSAIRPAVPR